MSKSCLTSPRQAIINGVFSIIIHLVGVVYTTPHLIAVNAQSHHRLQIIPFIIWILCIVTIVTSAVMIYGVLKKRYKLIAPYIYLGVIGMSVIGLSWVLVFIVFFTAFPIMLRDLFTATVITAFQILLWLPVYFLYKSWRTEATPTGRIIKLNDVNQALVPV